MAAPFWPRRCLTDTLALGRNIYRSRVDKTTFIAGAATLRYGHIVEVIDAAKGAGLQRAGIVTDGLRNSARAVRK